MEEVELHLPPGVAYVGFARLIVCAAARQAGMSEERVEDLRIAVSEATAIAAAAGDVSESEREALVLSFGVTDFGAFGVRIAGVSPDAAPPSAAERDGSLSDAVGLGVTVIRGLADDVRFVPRNDRIDLEFAIALSDDVKARADSGADVL